MLIVLVILREEKKKDVWIRIPHFSLDIHPSLFTLWL